VHSQIIKAIRKARNPIHPTTIPTVEEISVIDMSADRFSGDATPDDSRVLKLRIIPITVPSIPTAYPQSASAPPEIIVHFKVGFILFLQNVKVDSRVRLARILPLGVESVVAALVGSSVWLN